MFRKFELIDVFLENLIKFPIALCRLIFRISPGIACPNYLSFFVHFSGGCYYLSSTANPFLYSLLSKRFRRGFHDVVRYACGRFFDPSIGPSTGGKTPIPTKTPGPLCAPSQKIRLQMMSRQLTRMNIGKYCIQAELAYSHGQGLFYNIKELLGKYVSWKMPSVVTGVLSKIELLAVNRCDMYLLSI